LNNKCEKGLFHKYKFVKKLNIKIKGQLLYTAYDGYKHYLTVEFLRIFFTEIMNVKGDFCITTDTCHHSKLRLFDKGCQ